LGGIAASFADETFVFRDFGERFPGRAILDGAANAGGLGREPTGDLVDAGGIGNARFGATGDGCVVLEFTGIGFGDESAGSVGHAKVAHAGLATFGAKLDDELSRGIHDDGKSEDVT
jgi:hypothetical protein